MHPDMSTATGRYVRANVSVSHAPGRLLLGERTALASIVASLCSSGVRALSRRERGAAPAF